MLISKIVLCASVAMLGTTEATEASEQKSQPAAAKTQVNQPQPAPKTSETKKDEKKQQKTSETKKKDEKANAAPPEMAAKEVDGVRLLPIEANVVSFTNDERVRVGLPPLQVDKELMETAREHAAWMTRTGNMVHTSNPVAENIAMGQPDSDGVVRAWMNSSGHRANILNAAHRLIGVAAFRTENGVIFWCQQFRQ